MIEFMSVSKKLSFSKFTKFSNYEPKYCCKVKTELFNLIKATRKGENTFDEMHSHDFIILPFRYLTSDSSIILRLYYNKLVKFDTLRLTSYHLILV